MDWTSSLKRTRSRAIYSETTSSLSRLSSIACKRRKTLLARANHRSSHCYLEALPAELLQQIFLVSMNGNLIAASPLIAAKLSGHSSVYRAAFLLAFFSHDVDKLFNIHHLHFMIPMLDLPLSSWDVRSMTRAVLNSRWCTWAHVKLWLLHNVKYAATQLLKSTTSCNRREWIEEYLQGGSTDVESLFGLCWSGEDEQKRSWQLEPDPFDVRLTRDTDIDDDPWRRDAEHDRDYHQDPFTAEWHDELVLQCQMRIFGAVTIGEEKKQTWVPDFPDDAHFRRVVAEYSGLTIEKMKPPPSTFDFWQLLEDRAVRATRNSHWLRETLAIDYFLSPEDQPYSVSPRLYRAAAAADLRLASPIFFRRGSYLPVLHVLFMIDPLSLPRTDPMVLAWAAEARGRVLECRDNLMDIRDEIEELLDEQDGRLRDTDRNKYRARKLELKQSFEMDLNVLRYMKTGSPTIKVDAFAPAFAEPLPWLGERLNPSSKALTVTEMAGFPKADLWDVDLFEEGWAVDELWCDNIRQLLLLDELASSLGEFEMQIGPNDVLGEVDETESRHALTTYDGYYRSWDHDAYHDLFDEDFEVSDDHDDLDEWPTKYRYGEESRDDPFHVTEELMALDWVVLRPDRNNPIPPTIKDTKNPNPLFPPPEWFHAAEKPYFEEFPRPGEVQG